MKVSPASLLLHSGYGDIHCDLVIAAGRQCPTIALNVDDESLRLQTPHRRYYLTYSGSVSGNRGRVVQCWQGRVAWSLIRGKVRLWLPESCRLMLHDLRSRYAHGQFR